MVGYFLGKWSVAGGAWSVVGVTVVGGRWSVVGGWSVGGGFVLRRHETVIKHFNNVLNFDSALSC